MTNNSCTINGWIWYCDVHDTHGNADLQAEAEKIAEAHQQFWTDPDGCDITITQVKAPKQPVADTCAMCHNPPASMLAHQTGMQYGQMMERLRITAILDSDKPTCNTDFYNGNGCDCVVPYHELIDQIKGVTK